MDYGGRPASRTVTRPRSGQPTGHHDFSGEPAEVGWNLGRVAQAWAELMQRLGYTRYVAQGGDVGASVTDAMGRQAPDGCSAST
jgi:hypothetical protein